MCACERCVQLCARACVVLQGLSNRLPVLCQRHFGAEGTLRLYQALQSHPNPSGIECDCFEVSVRVCMYVHCTRLPLCVRACVCLRACVCVCD